MIEHGFTRTSVITRLRRGPLGAHLDTLAATLHQHGYAPESIRGSRSFGAKNNNPLEVLVFIGLFERLSWRG
jgi:hypothetical protein